MFQFMLSPIDATLPIDQGGVAAITYRMAPHFQNVLLTTGPDRHFTASYDGVNCVPNVIVLIEFFNPDRMPELTEFNMCKALGPPWSG